MSELKLNLEQRDIATYIGGSEVPVIVDCPDAWGTKMDVWMRRQPEFSLGDDASKATMFEAGHRFERPVMDWVAKLLGATEVKVGAPYDGPVVVGRESFMACHPDGYLRIGDKWYCYEGKLAQRSAHLFGPEGEMPDKYMVQWIWNMGCTGLDGIFGAQLSMQEAPWTHMMERKADIEEMLINKVGDWHHKHIVLGQPPELDGSPATASYLQQLHRDHTNEVRKATEAEERLIMELANARNLQKALEMDIARMEAEVKHAIGGDLGIGLGDKRRVTWKQRAGSRRIDSERLRAELPDVADKFTTQGEASRVLRASPSWNKL